MQLPHVRCTETTSCDLLIQYADSWIVRRAFGADASVMIATTLAAFERASTTSRAHFISTTTRQPLNDVTPSAVSGDGAS